MKSDGTESDLDEFDEASGDETVSEISDDESGDR